MNLDNSGKYPEWYYKTPEERQALVCRPEHFYPGREGMPIVVKRRFDLKPDEHLLDFGCGVLRIGIPVISYLDSRHFYGYDICPKRIQQAWAELRDYGLEYKSPVLTSDWGEIDRKFKHIWCYQVLIHVADDLLPGVIKQIKQALADDGMALISVNTDTEQWPTVGRWCEFPFLARPLSFYEEQFGKFGLKVRLWEGWEPESGERFIKVRHSR